MEKSKVTIALKMLGGAMMAESLMGHDSDVADIARQMTSAQRLAVLEAILVIEGIVRGVEGLPWNGVGEVDAPTPDRLSDAEFEARLVAELDGGGVRLPVDTDPHRRVTIGRNPADRGELP